MAVSAVATVKTINLDEIEGVKQLIVEFRDWIEKNSLLINCRLDNSFLMRFLRRENSTLAEAQNRLIRYLHLRQRLSHYYVNLNCDDKHILELINSGYQFVSPIRDKSGLRVIINIPKNADPSRFDYIQSGRLSTITMETLMEDENNRNLGVHCFTDLESVDMSYSALVSAKDFYIGMKYSQKAIPLKYRVHLVNLNPTLKVCYKFVEEMLPERFKQRIQIHSSIEEVHQHLDRQCLPKEYGGNIPMAEMIESWKEEIKRNKKNLASMENIQCLIPLPAENEHASFKKLQID